MLKNIKILIISVIAIFVIGNIFYYQGINSSVSQEGQDVYFTINKGEGVDEIGENLEEAGLIDSKFYFKIYAKRQGMETKLQAGEYNLNPILSIKEIVKFLTEGRSLSNEKTIKIIEGWNIKDIDEYLAKQGIISKGQFIKQSSSLSNWMAKSSGPGAELDKSASVNASLEGYLFPDTYRIFKDAGVEDVIWKMLGNFNNKVTQEMKADIQKQGRTLFEIVTMASLIEKEVRIEKDMKIVSGIFWDRIKNGQALESCATLAYILGVNKPQYTTEDTKINSPYNTYQNRGLPPGPISNPGLKAIKAAVYPEYTDYNYFLNKQDTGETVFSVSYDEHLKNKAKYLR